MNINEARVLVDRYMDGETTAGEERALRHFFRTATNLPDEWQPLRALFAYVDHEVAQGDWATEQSTETEQPTGAELQTGAEPQKKPHLCVSRWWWTGAVAASLLGALLLWPKTDNARNFAVIDGERVTDQRIVEREAEQALQLVAISDEEAFSALDEMN